MNQAQSNFKKQLESNTQDPNLIREVESFIQRELNISEETLPRKFYGYLNTPTHLTCATRNKLLQIVCAQYLELDLVNITYQSDQFVLSEGKGFLVRGSYVDGKAANLFSANAAKKLRGKSLNTIELDDGMNLVTYHEQRFQTMLDSVSATVSLYDFSSFYNGKSASEYYPSVLALSLLMPIMDSFVYPNMPPQLARFRDGVFLPAKERLQAAFGQGPLVVSVPEIDNPNSFFFTVDQMIADKKSFENLTNGITFNQI